MEGITNEACSLAGHWGLGKLIAFYDDNHISIDGDTRIAFTETVDKRFEALGWHIIWVKNSNTGYDEIRAAIEETKSVTDKPTLIKVTTTIGFGSPNKANSYSVHRAALGAKEVDATRENLGWPYKPFHVPDDVKILLGFVDFDFSLCGTGAAIPPRVPLLKLNGMLNLQNMRRSMLQMLRNSIADGVLPAGWEKDLPHSS